MAGLPVATTLDEAYLACDPDQPLPSGDSRWTDFSEGRGDDATATLVRRFEISGQRAPLHVAFFSHRGAGKTTELNRVGEQLRRTAFTVYFEANTELDPNHLESEDLLLVIAQVVEERLRTAGMPLDEAILADVERWFVDQVRTTSWARSLGLEASAGGGLGVPWFTRLALDIKAAFRTQAEAREEIREVFRRKPSALVDAVNRVLDAANRRLRDSGRSLLIVIDNLDRYAPAIVDRLLVERGALIDDLKTHMILTPPIALLYKPHSESLASRYDHEVMNTLRLRRPHDPYDAFDGPGRDLMVEALRRRMAVDALIPEPAVRDRLVAASGGAIRSLLHLIQRSVLLSKGPVLVASAVDRAVARERVQLRDQVNLNGWAATLAWIQVHKQPSAEPASMDVLFHRLALKDNGEGWYDVHPLIADLEELARAREALG
ncbi:MAG TPA: hypothetical protein PKA64_18535 [Myxococcota bacterium]|nr:hypothetical protein [Myxococcota bacterium]